MGREKEKEFTPKKEPLIIRGLNITRRSIEDRGNKKWATSPILFILLF